MNLIKNKCQENPDNTNSNRSVSATYHDTPYNTDPVLTDAVPSAALAGPLPQHTEIAFVESNVADYQVLANGVNPGVEAHVPDASLDGLAYILNEHADQVSTRAVHLDSLILTAAQNLSDHAANPAIIGIALNPGTAILLYGCNTATGFDEAAALKINELHIVTLSGVSVPTIAPAYSLASKALLFNNDQVGTGAIAKLTDAYLNTIDSRAHWNRTTLTYSFNETIPNEYLSKSSVLTANWHAFNAAEKSVTQSALQRISEFTSLVFNQEPGNLGDIRFNKVDMSPRTALGFSIYPTDNGKLGGDVWINNTISAQENAYQPGTAGPLTIMHEIGHALGLKHSFEGSNVLPATLNNYGHTIMSYTSYKNLSPTFSYDNTLTYHHIIQAYPTEYSLYDVEALQAIYGANKSYHTGADTYSVDANQYRTLWDAGGVDTIDASSATGTCTVNLCPGEFSSLNVQTLAQQQAATLSYYRNKGITGDKVDNWVADIYSGSNSSKFYTGENNLAIVLGVWIENINTGIANDFVLDNAVNNRINTGNGDDLIQLYWGGYDMVNGGIGSDTIQVLDKQSQTTLEKQSDGSYLIVGSYFSAQLIGIETVHFSDGIRLL